MNKFILVAMNRKNHTQEELEANVLESVSAASYAYAHANDAASYAYAHANTGAKTNDAYAYAASYTAAEAASHRASLRLVQDVEYWIGRYFEATREDRSEYEQEIKRRNDK